jgi:hypothetical protein
VQIGNGRRTAANKSAINRLGTGCSYKDALLRANLFGVGVYRDQAARRAGGKQYQKKNRNYPHMHP